MAAIVPRNGKWQARIRRKGHPTESASFTNKADALRWATNREAEMNKANYGIAPDRTVRQMLERYVEKVSPTKGGWQWESVRIGKYLGNGKHPKRDALPFLDKLVAQVSPEDISDWRDACLKRLAPNTVKREYGLLHTIFATAQEDWGWLATLPFRKKGQPKGGAPRKRRVHDADVDTILKHLGYTPGTVPTTKSQFVAASFLWCRETAMRSGEALSLDREEIVGRVAHLAKTKNGDPRPVPLSAAAMAMLELLPTEGRIFPVSKGTRDSLFRRARDRAGLKGDLVFHDTRREGTSQMAKKVDVLQLAKITGHKDLKVLLTTYYHPDLEEVAKQLD